MRLRVAQFAMIPMWVMQHPNVHGDGTRMAVYAGLQAASFEAPEREWRSTRQMASAVAEITGIGDEACRKHLTTLIQIGAILKTATEVLMPADPPGLGISLGTTVPNLGMDVPKTETHTSTSLREKEKTPVGTTRDTQTAEPTESGEGDSRINQIADAYAFIAVEKAQPERPDAYARSARQTALAHPDLDKYLERWPTAPATAVAAWLHGDKHSMAYFPEAHHSDENPPALVVSMPDGLRRRRKPTGEIPGGNL